jgi:hypothetical protein
MSGQLKDAAEVLKSVVYISNASFKGFKAMTGLRECFSVI